MIAHQASSCISDNSYSVYSFTNNLINKLILKSNNSMQVKRFNTYIKNWTWFNDQAVWMGPGAKQAKVVLEWKKLS